MGRSNEKLQNPKQHAAINNLESMAKSLITTILIDLCCLFVSFISN